MIPRALWLLGGLGTVLAGTIGLQLGGLELGRIVADDMAVNANAPRPDSVELAVPAAAQDGRLAWADTVLARPLFTVGRRPVAGPVATPVMPANLPRLAGVLVNGADRSVIFAGADGGRPMVAVVGGQVGGWTVQSIDAGSVTLSGPAGTQVLRPAFDASRSPRSDARRDAGPSAAAPAPFAAATEVMPSLRDLPGFSGPAAR